MSDGFKSSLGSVGRSAFQCLRTASLQLHAKEWAMQAVEGRVFRRGTRWTARPTAECSAALDPRQGFASCRPSEPPKAKSWPEPSSPTLALAAGHAGLCRLLPRASRVEFLEKMALQPASMGVCECNHWNTSICIIRDALMMWRCPPVQI